MAATSQKRSGTTDLTVGKPLFQILRFALPLVLGTLFQQLYSFADTVIVGRCLGTDALGAVGTTYSLNFLILGFVQGACVGFGIPALSGAERGVYGAYHPDGGAAAPAHPYARGAVHRCGALHPAHLSGHPGYGAV